MLSADIAPRLPGGQKEPRRAPVASLNRTSDAELVRRLGLGINQVTPRVLELRNSGKCASCATRKCTVTGSTAVAWEPTEPAAQETVDNALIVLFLVYMTSGEQLGLCYPHALRRVLRAAAACSLKPSATRACPQLSQMIAAARWIAARKFLAVLS